MHKARVETQKLDQRQNSGHRKTDCYEAQIYSSSHPNICKDFYRIKQCISYIVKYNFSLVEHWKFNLLIGDPRKKRRKEAEFKELSFQITPLI